MKIKFALLLFVSIISFSFAQEEKSETQFPQFNECELDDQNGQPCFENTFRQMFVANYQQTEIASDYNYNRELKGSFIVNRRGDIKQLGYNSPESAMFLAVERAVEKLPRLKPAVGDQERPVDFQFQVIFKLSRSEPYAKEALKVEVEFTYEDEKKESL